MTPTQRTRLECMAQSKTWFASESETSAIRAALARIDELETANDPEPKFNAGDHVLVKPEAGVVIGSATCSKGRKYKVELEDDTFWFDEWQLIKMDEPVIHFRSARRVPSGTADYPQ